MARCDACGKQPVVGRTVARLGKNAMNRRIKGRAARVFQPNVQSVRTVAGRRNLCTKCIKSGVAVKVATYKAPRLGDRG